MSIEYFIGDTVEFRKKEYFVIGINPDRERPIALNNYNGEIIYNRRNH